MSKIYKVAILSVLLLTFGCGKKNTSLKKTASNIAGNIITTSESKLDTHSCCETRGAGVIHFEFDRSEVLPESQKMIDDSISKCVANALIKNPDLKVLVVGHADKRGTQEYNIALGHRRANSTTQYLIGAVRKHEGTEGISEDHFCTDSKGKEQLIDHGDTEEAHAKNRRAVIEFVDECTHD